MAEPVSTVAPPSAPVPGGGTAPLWGGASAPGLIQIAGPDDFAAGTTDIPNIERMDERWTEGMKYSTSEMISECPMGECCCPFEYRTFVTDLFATYDFMVRDKRLTKEMAESKWESVDEERKRGFWDQIILETKMVDERGRTVEPGIVHQSTEALFKWMKRRPNCGNQFTECLGQCFCWGCVLRRNIHQIEHMIEKTDSSRKSRLAGTTASRLRWRW